MVAGLTLLPALLTVFGRHGLLAAQGHRSSTTRTTRPTSAIGVWRRFGDKVLQRPAFALIVTVTVFVAGALGILAYKVDYSTTTFFKKKVDAVTGFKILERVVPAGHDRPDDRARPQRGRDGDQGAGLEGGRRARRA